jgi:hypothetical protein
VQESDGWGQSCKHNSGRTRLGSLDFERLLNQFAIGKRAMSNITGLTADQHYNNGVAAFRRCDYRTALEAFERSFRSGQYMAQAAYAGRVLCNQELGQRIVVPVELIDQNRAEDIGAVYVASNLAGYLVEQGYEADLVTEGHQSEVTARIGGAPYKLQIMASYGTFSNWAWRLRPREKAVSVPDPDANPHPTDADRIAVNLIAQASTLPLSPIPRHPFGTGQANTWFDLSKS